VSSHDFSLTGSVVTTSTSVSSHDFSLTGSVVTTSTSVSSHDFSLTGSLLSLYSILFTSNCLSDDEFK
jgi:predicted DNA-binding helix-hairpin-helix protein